MHLNVETTTLEDLRAYQRFNVIGTAGSGKSTFGRRLARVLELPYVELDQLFWKPAWVESTDRELFAKVKEAVAQEAWVLDGNYTRTAPIKWPRTELVIWLDMPFATTIRRVTRRAVQRSLSGVELWPDTGNRESFRSAFLTRDSIIWWSIKHYAENRKRYRRQMESQEYPQLVFLRLTTPEQVDRLLGGEKGDGAAA